MSDISAAEWMTIQRKCNREAVHEATDMYEPFSDQWYRAITEITYSKVRAITTPPPTKCSECGR